MDEEDTIVYEEFLYPENDKRLKKFKTLSKEDQLNSIYIGSNLLNISEEKYNQLKNGENQLQKEKMRIRYEDELSEKNQLIQSLRDKIYDIESNYSRERKKLRDIISSEIDDKYKVRYTAVMETYEEDLSELKTKVRKLESDKLNKQENFFREKTEINEKYQEKIEKQRKEYELKLDEYRKKVEIVTEFKENSAKKGQEGESWLYNELIRQFPKSTIVDCHKKDHRGDFTLEDDVKGMIESKNYKKNVPKKEIVKFKKDIESNEDFKYGILLSLKSGVTNRDDFCLEFCSGKPMVFLHFIKENPSKIKLAHKICKLILKNVECFDTKSEEKKQLIKEKTKTMTARHNKMISSVKNFTKEIENQIIEQWDDLSMLLKRY